MRSVFALLALCAALAACSRPEPAARSPVGPLTVSTAEAKAAAALISRHRVAQGLPPVTVDPALNQAAEIQARAVAEAGALSHGDFAGRMRRLGIPGHAAENLSAGSREVSDVVARWTASPRHHENLLLPQARRIGLARVDAAGSRYGRYWALVLAQ